MRKLPPWRRSGEFLVTELITPFADAALGLPVRGGAKTGANSKFRPWRPNPNGRPPNWACSCSMAGRCVSAGRSWGKRKTKENRVEWHEWKTGVYYRHEQSARTAGWSRSHRGQARHRLAGRPGGVGPAVALGGFARRVGPHPRARLVVGDGAAWIWNVAQDRWRGSTELLDFYHASTNTYGFWGAPSTRMMKPPPRGGPNPFKPPTAAWEPEESTRRDRRFESSQRRSGQGGGARTELFRRPCRQDELPGHPPSRLAHRFQGAAESACRQRQCRFKTPPGNFGRPQECAITGALTEARLNNHSQDELWPAN